jgi:hypothetical protein
MQSPRFQGKVLFLFYPEDGDSRFLRNIAIRLEDATSKGRVIFIAIPERTSNFTFLDNIGRLTFTNLIIARVARI